MATVTIGKQGRIVLPAELRQRLGMAEGDTLIVTVQDGAIVLEPREVVRARLREAFGSAGGNAVDELIAERRAEAARELAEE